MSKAWALVTFGALAASVFGIWFTLTNASVECLDPQSIRHCAIVHKK